MGILVIAAHPDDEVLGCGGYIAKRQGVHILILGDGVTSRYDDPREGFDEVYLRKQASRKVADMIGAKVEHYEFPDNRFDTVPLLDIVKVIERKIDQVQPQTIFTHHGGDLNIDHATTYRATLTAARPMASRSVHAVYAYEVPSSSEWAFQSFQEFRPNWFVDIDDTLPMKLRMLVEYDGEVRKFPHPRSPEAIEAIASRWGSVVGIHRAEAFQLIWARQS